MQKHSSKQLVYMQARFLVGHYESESMGVLPREKKERKKLKCLGVLIVKFH